MISLQKGPFVALRCRLCRAGVETKILLLDWAKLQERESHVRIRMAWF